MESTEVKGRKDKGMSRQEVLNFRMGHSNAATGLELKECMIAFFHTLSSDFREPPTVEDEKRFSIQDIRVWEPFDAVSQAIRLNIKKFKEEYAEEIKAEQEEDEVGETPLKKTKRKRLDDFAKKPHMVFAQKAKMPFWNNLIKPFEAISRKRNQHRVVRCKRDVNAITPLMRKWKLEKLKDQFGVRQVAENTLVYHVTIFKPSNAMDCFTKDQEILILGHQTLAQLKDAFYCIQDRMLVGPTVRNSYIHIEDTFYDDTRHSGYTRLSSPIVDWIKCKKRHIDPGLCRFTQRNMSETRIQELAIRLGSHYEYLHQGNCSHTLVFEQIRILTPDDIQNEFAYPWKKFQQVNRRQKCGVCDIFPSKWVTYGDRLTTQNPFFFCNKCYYKLHYDENGDLLSTDYRVFDYEHS